MMATTFWHPDGTPMSAQQFMEMLFGNLSIISARHQDRFLPMMR
jgi:hypothetical protein